MPQRALIPYFVFLNMSLRKLYYSLSPNLRFIARKIYYSPIDAWETLSRKRHKYEPLKGDIYTGSGDFIKQGNHHLELLIKHISLVPSDHVLDIGSGIGRTASALTNYIDKNGSYKGFDVVKKGVDWCKNRITKDNLNFEFLYVPLQNDLYNQSIGDAKAFTFPYKNDSFTKSFLFSVFTHMQKDEIENYLKEISRVLKPSGQCLATFFTYNQETENFTASNPGFNFPVNKETHRLMNAEVTAANIALFEPELDRMIAAAGLEKRAFIPGFWRDQGLKAKGRDFQDVLILKKV